MGQRAAAGGYVGIKHNGFRTFSREETDIGNFLQYQKPMSDKTVKPNERRDTW